MDFLFYTESLNTDGVFDIVSIIAQFWIFISCFYIISSFFIIYGHWNFESFFYMQTLSIKGNFFQVYIFIILLESGKYEFWIGLLLNFGISNVINFFIKWKWYGFII